jgi:plasmid stabilization system protein ParE
LRRSLRVSENAQRQIRKAAEWWRQNRPAARELLSSEVRRGFDLISSDPGIGAPASDLEPPGLRRLHLSRIHYHIYYRLADDDAVEVLGFWHTSRGTTPEM